jgi:hypothetical protein
VFVSEPFFSNTAQQLDELHYLGDQLEMITILSMQASILSDASQVQTADKATLTRMKKDYEELLKIL